jgi:antitoxin PrlF
MLNLGVNCPLDVQTAIMVLHLLICNGVKMESAITIKGQATIPKAIREHLGLEPGDRVKFFVHPDGSVVLLPKLPASAVRGMVKSRNARAVTTGQMTAAVAEGASSRNPRRHR